MTNPEDDNSAAAGSHQSDAVAGPAYPPSQPPAAPHVRKRKGHRAGKKKRSRRKSFAVAPDDESHGGLAAPSGLSAVREGFYAMHGRNLSTTSIDSETLLDHREQQQFLRPRRSSTMATGGSQSYLHVPSSSRLRNIQAGESGGEEEDEVVRSDEGAPLLSNSARHRSTILEPLLTGAGAGGGYGSNSGRPSPRTSRLDSRASSVSRRNAAGGGGRQQMDNPFTPTEGAYNVNYPPSVPGSPGLGPSASAMNMSFVDAMLRDELSDGASPRRRSGETAMDESRGGDGKDMDAGAGGSSRPAPPPFERRKSVAQLAVEEDVCFPHEGLSDLADDELHHLHDGAAYRIRRRRRGKWPDLAYLDEWARFEKEVRGVGEGGDDAEGTGTRKRGATKKITEPQLVNGRLRPTHKGWYRSEEDAPYRFTYFNEEFQSTIHSQTISELVQPGSSFRELFIPDFPLLSDSEYDDDDDDELMKTTTAGTWGGGGGIDSKLHSRLPSVAMPNPMHAEVRAASTREAVALSPPSPLLPQQPPQLPHERDTSTTAAVHERHSSGHATPSGGGGGGNGKTSIKSPLARPMDKADSGMGLKAVASPPRYGDRPVWWLDVLSPTEAEMKVLSKTFGIHPLTAEDIMVQEAREKVELFRHYYFVNYRTFEQDPDSENFLEPVNMYVVVFREGVLSFHFSMTPHPANVRRRVRQLRDYLILSSDWISYAIIDDITDVFGPLIQAIEEEVDDIDDAILQLHSSSAVTGFPGTKDHSQHTHYYQRRIANNAAAEQPTFEKRRLLSGFGNGGGSSEPQQPQPESGADMLRRVGDCRKKVMGLYRLLGNKADVIKGFAKRCNEHWEVAPRSEIGLYLGDIQDHIVTMTSNLSHYEKILARSHANYLAQINIRMNERQEQTADVLGKLTVLGTIVLPMNIITGLWGMNVWVPGQQFEGDLTWFWVITAGLLCFGLACYMIAKRVYNIV